MTRSISIPLDDMLNFMGASKRRLEVENTRVAVESLKVGEFAELNKALPFAEQEKLFDEFKLSMPFQRKIFALETNCEVKKPLKQAQILALGLLDKGAKETGFMLSEVRVSDNNPILYLAIERPESALNPIELENKALPPHEEQELPFYDYFKAKEKDYVLIGKGKKNASE